MSMASINPATGEAFETYPEHDLTQAERIIEEAHEAFAGWAARELPERTACLRGAAVVLREARERFASLITREMGKPITESRGEIDKCAWLCDYYAEQALVFLAPEGVKTDAPQSYVAFEPLGVILAIMPWNFPFWQVFRAAVPALVAGNTMVLKHAANVSGCSLAIEEIFHAAGIPEGAFRSVLVHSGDAPRLIAHPKVRGVTLTGSTTAGRSVAAEAGKALKKTVLELGGSDPYLILEDADVPAAAAACAQSRLINAGQSCIAAKRFIVVRAALEAFERELTKAMRAYRMGNPEDEATQIGPLARMDLREMLHLQVTESCRGGARLLLGGSLPEGPGAFYPPTVLADVEPGMPAFDEELFGPVAAIVPAGGEDEAVDLANRSPFGLGAAVFTHDREKGERIARNRLQAGSCFVNTFVRSDPRLPFGGIKDSGYGRELSHFGLREFTNIKTVYIQ